MSSGATDGAADLSAFLTSPQQRPCLGGHQQDNPPSQGARGHANRIVAQSKATSEGAEQHSHVSWERFLMGFCPSFAECILTPLCRKKAQQQLEHFNLNPVTQWITWTHPGCERTFKSYCSEANGGCRFSGLSGFFNIKAEARRGSLLSLHPDGISLALLHPHWRTVSSSLDGRESAEPNQTHF